MNFLKKAKEQLVKPRVFVPLGITFIVALFGTLYYYYTNKKIE